MSLLINLFAYSLLCLYFAYLYIFLPIAIKRDYMIINGYGISIAIPKNYLECALHRVPDQNCFKQYWILNLHPLLQFFFSWPLSSAIGWTWVLPSQCFTDVSLLLFCEEPKVFLQWQMCVDADVLFQSTLHIFAVPKGGLFSWEFCSLFWKHILVLPRVSRGKYICS